MKTGIVTTLIALCLPVSVFATTLRLSTDVDLLVLDGKKVSSSLLRGADSIELDNGPHQLVFRVEKTIHLSNSEERRLMYVALTRARHRVWALFNKENPSPFVEILKNLDVPVARKP